MKSLFTRLLAIAVAGTAVLAALPAQAHDDDRYGWREERGWHRDWEHRRHCREPYAYREVDRVVVRERPVVREYGYYEAPVYRQPAPVYYGRQPAVVLGVSLPPIVLPFR